MRGIKNVQARNIILAEAVLNPLNDSLLWVKVSSRISPLLENFPRYPGEISSMGHTKGVTDLPPVLSLEVCLCHECCTGESKMQANFKEPMLLLFKIYFWQAVNK